MADITIGQLANEMAKLIGEYTEGVAEGIGNEVLSTADKVLKDVKLLARKHTGEYAKTFIKTDKSLPGNRRYVVWNKKHYRRVHLLEYGHAKVGGGRVPAYPHLRPAHDKYADEMVDNIKRIIENGG